MRVFLFLLYIILMSSVQAIARHKVVKHKPPAAVTYVSPDFCAALVKVIGGSKTKFEGLKGITVFAAIDDYEWDSKLKFTGAKKNVVVFGAGLWTDFISTLFISNDRILALKVYRLYKNAMTSCLSGRGYIQEDTGRDHFWQTDGEVCKYLPTDEDRTTYDTTLPVITLALDSIGTRGQQEKQYYLSLEVWDLKLGK